MDKVKKIGLFSLIAFCMGDTIGAGIFSSLPVAVGYVGPGIMWTWLAAIVMTIFVNIPAILPSSSLPCPSASYTLPCRLLSPYIGFFELIAMMNYILILGLLGIFFADYVNILIPGIPTKAVAVGVIVLFWVINLFGVDSGTTVQNGIVVVLAFSLLAYVVTGFPQMSSEHLVPAQLIAPSGISFTAFCACLALTFNCLGGCFTGCLVLGDRVKNPRRNLILGGCLTALIVGFLFCMISVVTCGVTDWTQTLPLLGDIAKSFMPTGLWYVFMVGGALGAMVSTINAVILSVGYRFDTMAADGIFPAAFDKSCRFGTKPLSIAIAPVFGIVTILLDPPLDALMTACATLAVIASILRLLPVLVLPKRYPHTYRRAIVVLSKPVLWGWVMVAIIVCTVVSISAILETTGAIWVVVFGVLAVMYLYFILRVQYMKRKGVDIYKNMSAPYPEWDEKEEEYRRADEAKSTAP